MIVIIPLLVSISVGGLFYCLRQKNRLAALGFGLAIGLSTIATWQQATVNNQGSYIDTITAQQSTIESQKEAIATQSATIDTLESSLNGWVETAEKTWTLAKQQKQTIDQQQETINQQQRLIRGQQEIINYAVKETSQLAGK